MKILFFITSLEGGGAEKVLVNMVNHMDKKKYDITVQCLFDVGVNKQFLSPNVKYKYIFKHIIHGNVIILKFFSPKFLYRRMIDEKYDIVVSYFQSPTTRIVAGCTDKDVKLVQWIHNEFHDRERIAVCYRNMAECTTLQKRFDANVYVANTVKESYLSTFPELEKNDYVLYNVVESDMIRAKAGEQVESELYNREFTLISVGRMVPQKSFDRLLNIVNRLKKDGYDFRLLLLGSGTLKNRLEEQAQRLGIKDNVTFLGYNINPYKYIKNADLFVCSSLHEGFSTAVTESLIVGTPVVTTMCSGMEELLGNNEFGVIVDNSEDALYQGVKDLLSNQDKLQYYRKKARERGEKFEVSETINSIEKFFDSF
jgi:glycosyltransferase involved in cell wall biosynthesis